jgi:cysteine synthase
VKQAESNEFSRRRFALAGLSAGAALLAARTLSGERIPYSSSEVNPAEAATIAPGSNTSFTSLKQIDAGLLRTYP